MAGLSQLALRFAALAPVRPARSVSMTSLLLMIARFGGAGLGVMMQILIARLYGADTLGHFFLAFGVASVFSIILSAGFPWIIAVIVARSEADSDPGLLAGFMRTAYRHQIVAGLFLAIPAAAAVWLYPDISPSLRAALLIGIASAPVYALMRLFGSLANARKWFVLANAPELLLRPLFLLVLVAGAALASLPLDAAGIVAINLGVTIVLTAWLYRALHRAGPTPATPGSMRAVPSGSQAREWRSLAMPMIVATLFVNVFADLEILIFGTLAPAAMAGVFGAAIKITMLFAFAVQSVHQIILRDASDALLHDDRSGLLGAMRSANIFAIATMAAALGGAILFGREVLSFFGPGFGDGHACLVLLLLAQLVRAMGGPSIQVLMIAGKQRHGVKVHLVAIVLLVALNAALVPAYGLEGAGLAVIATMAVWTVWLARLARKATGVTVSALALLPGRKPA